MSTSQEPSEEDQSKAPSKTIRVTCLTADISPGKVDTCAHTSFPCTWWSEGLLAAERLAAWTPGQACQ
eukprot:299138-Pelagomonas_calceolata.AAC.2